MNRRPSGKALAGVLRENTGLCFVLTLEMLAFLALGAYMLHGWWV